MRIFALSDLHVDYPENRRWVLGLSKHDYTEDALILAGDVTDIEHLLAEAFDALGRRFSTIVFVPGNHDLWVHRNSGKDSLEQLGKLGRMAADNGIHLSPVMLEGITIIPLHAWYDYSFGKPSREILLAWTDFIACRWPEGMDEKAMTAYFLGMNHFEPLHTPSTVITFSHFLPRIDLMPSVIPQSKRYIYPVLGTSLLDEQIRRINPSIHVYGHTHVNRHKKIDGITYINNAYGYPDEKLIAAKRLLCIHDTEQHPHRASNCNP